MPYLVLLVWMKSLNWSKYTTRGKELHGNYQQSPNQTNKYMYTLLWVLQTVSPQYLII